MLCSPVNFVADDDFGDASGMEMVYLLEPVRLDGVEGIDIGYGKADDDYAHIRVREGP